MAQKLVIEIDLEKGDVSTAVKQIEKELEKSGKKSASKFRDAFNKDISANLKSIGGMVAKATAAVTALGGAITTALAVKGVQAANVQEDAINRLNTALQLSGDFTNEASADFQRYASELQQATRFGDELILNQVSLAKSFGATNAQAKQVVTAAADLSAAFGIDLESATRNVAKTLGGFAGELGEVIPDLKNLTQAQLQAGSGIDVLAKRFSGAANKDVNTFSGALTQLSNTVGDLFEEIGFLITQNPSFTKAIKSLTGLFSAAGSSVSTFAKNFDAFSFITEKLIGFNRAVINNVIAPLEMAKNVGNIVFNAIAFAVQTVVEKFASFGLTVSTFLNKIGLEGQDAVNRYKTLVESTAEVTEEMAGKLNKSLESLYDFSISDKLMQKNDELRQFFVDQNAIAQENQDKKQNMIDQSNQVAQESLIGLKGIFGEVGSAFTTNADQMAAKTEEVNKKVKKFAQDSGVALRNGLAQGAGRAFAEFGAALVNGENALEAFTRSFLKAIGEQAVALGTRFILEGAAYAFVPGYQALSAPLIAAGAALAAFGGAIGALTGGGSESGGGGASAVSGTDQAFADTNQELASPELAQEAEERVNLNLNIEGSLVRESELNGYITNLLEEGSSRDANIVPSLRTG